MKVGRAEFQEQVRGQVTYLNTLTLDAIDDVLGASDDPPVIIVMSDHGTRMDVTYGDPTDPDLDERMNNLFAAYTPVRPTCSAGNHAGQRVADPLQRVPRHGLSVPRGPVIRVRAGNPLELHSLGKKSPGSNPACGQTTEQGYR